MSSDNADGAQWAIDLLTADPNYQENLLAKYSLQISSTLVAALTPLVHNLVSRRPLHAGLPSYIKWTAGGFILGHFLDKHVRERNAIRDAMYRDYIRLHPEDFPEPERRKWADVFQMWIPLR